jgi:hypothetical protein
MFPRQLDGRFHAVRQNDELSILIVSCLTNRYTLASFIGWSSFKAVRALNTGVDKDREPEPRRFPMLLQDHPLVSHSSVPSWPPAWTWVAGSDNQHPKGEIGILKAVAKSNIEPAVDVSYISITKVHPYIGCLPCDHAFCGQLVKVLEANRNKPIAEIGGLDLA